jgi:hypothetical protein
MMADQVPVVAKSLFSSKTFWVNAGYAIVSLLSATDVVTIIPPKLLPLTTAIVAGVNILLRMITVQPVAFVSPGTTVPVLVDPPKPPTTPVKPAITD